MQFPGIEPLMFVTVQYFVGIVSIDVHFQMQLTQERAALFRDKVNPG